MIMELSLQVSQTHKRRFSPVDGISYRRFSSAAILVAKFREWDWEDSAWLPEYKSSSVFGLIASLYNNPNPRYSWCQQSLARSVAHHFWSTCTDIFAGFNYRRRIFESVLPAQSLSFWGDRPIWCNIDKYFCPSQPRDPDSLLVF